MVLAAVAGARGVLLLCVRRRRRARSPRSTTAEGRRRLQRQRGRVDVGGGPQDSIIRRLCSRVGQMFSFWRTCFVRVFFLLFCRLDPCVRFFLSFSLGAPARRFSSSGGGTSDQREWSTGSVKRRVVIFERADLSNNLYCIPIYLVVYSTPWHW